MAKAKADKKVVAGTEANVAAPVAPAKAEKVTKALNVLDANGKLLFSTKDKEEATDYVKVHGGRIARDGETLVPIKEEKKSE